MSKKSGARPKRPKKKVTGNVNNKVKKGAANGRKAKAGKPASNNKAVVIKPGQWRKHDPAYERESRKYDNPIPSREFILQQLQAMDGPCRRNHLFKAMGVANEDVTQALHKRLDAMIRAGQLVENRKGAIGPSVEMDLIAGVVLGHRDGFGFLRPDAGGDDVFLNPRQMRSLLHGDRAVVRIMGEDRRGRPEGSLVDVLERANTHIVGRYMREHGIGVVTPDNTRISQDVLVADADAGGAKPGQMVSVEIIQQPGKRSQPVGKIVEVLGGRLDAGMAVDVAIRSFGLPHEWPDAVRKQVGDIPDEVPARAKKGRRDLRDLPLVTIDGADARDFDDAVFCEPLDGDEGGWRLWVAIADVSAYVEVGDALDTEARNRGTSVYFPNRVIPMLPEVLSNGLCSINPQVDRLCMVCEMRIGKDGKVLGSKFHEGLMRSHARLTYEQVWAMLQDASQAAEIGVEPLLPHLNDLYALYKAMARARKQRGAIDFETTETKITFADDGSVNGIKPVVRNEAHKIIEECMIAANVEAAKFLSKKKMPLLYRSHPPPDPEKMDELRGFLKECGLSLAGGENPRAKDYAQVLKKALQREDAHLIQTVLLRSLSQAIYTPKNDGHFGLSLSHYAHFTSPIRRYPDLLVHRAIRHILQGGKPAAFEYGHNEMETLGNHCSTTERRADEASRDAEQRLTCEFMQAHLGEVFEGRVTGVTSFGLFLQLDEVYAEGLVHISALDNDYYHHDAAGHRLVGERSGRIHSLMDRMKVKVVRVDPDERKIDFEPV